MAARMNDDAIAEALTMLAGVIRQVPNANVGNIKKDEDAQKVQFGTYMIEKEVEDWWGNTVQRCEKPKKDQGKGKVFALSGSETAAEDRLIQVTTSFICLNCQLSIFSRDFDIDQVGLPLDKPDVNLGMNWLEYNHVYINSFDKTVIFPEIGVEEDLFLSAKQVNEYVQGGVVLFMLLATLAICEKRMIGDLLIVRDFPELDQLVGACVLSKIDLRYGFHPIRVKDEDIQKTTFRMKYGYYEYYVTLFNVTNAHGVVLEYMNRIFHQYLDKFVVVLIDDILIYSKSEEEHGVNFLSHVISSDGIVVDPFKIEVVSQWESVKSVTEIRSFLGLVGYYQKFIEGFSKLSLSLTQLTRKSQAFIWTSQCEAGFQELKRRRCVDAKSISGSLCFKTT
ncbi:uncharacterized protein LOC131651130 [Vicia villosa]|uniref:uncharacterized protein LOC131651130 n=1 Tax=Vicia villosa TaxID=3911 RepID=UPI00273C6DDE|nr:uncharacterized protein LOC131651130 [Vicia villosa]